MNAYSAMHEDKPYLLEKNGTVCEINKAFLELSGFSPSDLMYKPFEYVWNELLRISAQPNFYEKPKEALLFSLELEPVCVFITSQKNVEGNGIKFEITEKTDSKLNSEYPVIDYLYAKGKSGVAMYSAPDLILLKANQIYLNFLDEPFRSRNCSIGRSKYDIVSNFRGSKFDSMIREVIETGDTLEVREEPYIGHSRGITYWDTTFVPIYEAGQIKYLMQLSHDVTNEVNNRLMLEAQNKYIYEQKQQMEAILENMSDSLCIFDSEGKYTLFNKAARDMFLSYYKYMNKTGDGYYQAENYDPDGKQIPLKDIPANRIKRGEKFTSMRMEVRHPDKTQHLEVSGTPLYDAEGSFNMGVLCSRDITDLVHKEKLILQQNKELLDAEIRTREALEASMKLKDEFIYLISHEMRTPSAIIGSALQAIELMHAKELTPNVRKYLNTIKQNTNRQLRLINNLLDITRISSGSIKLNNTAIEIVNLTKKIVDSVEVYGKQKGIEITFSSELRRKTTFLDEEKLERILLNLLANAVKFTPNGKGIRVCLYSRKRRNKSVICISVNDEGIGIPIEKQSMIFERFGQVDSSLSRQAEGTGLGLTLVKMLVEAMGGEIRLESEPGKGSTFTVVFPVIKPAVDIDESSTNNQNLQPYSEDDRIVKAASIEFSDIYFD